MKCFELSFLVSIIMKTNLFGYRGSHDYLRAHKGSRRMSRPFIQKDPSVRVLFPRYKINLT